MPSPSSPLPDHAGLKKLRVADLKELLEARGLEATGRKDDLIARLEAARGDETNTSDGAPPPSDADPAARAEAASEPEPGPEGAEGAEGAEAERDRKEEADVKPLALHVSEAAEAKDRQTAASSDPHHPAAGGGAAGPKVYVGFLGENCNRQFIIDLFKDYFTPERIYIAQQTRGNFKEPKGYAFVDGPAGSEAQAQAAIDALNASAHYPGAKYPLKLSFAVRKESNGDDAQGGDNKRKRDEHQDNAHGGKKRFNDVPPGKSPTRLFVAGMPVSVTEELVKSVFRPHGNIKGIFLLRPRDGEENRPRRGIVEFDSPAAAAAAKKALHGVAGFHGGGELSVTYATPRPDGSGGGRGGSGSRGGGSGSGGGSTGVMMGGMGGMNMMGMGGMNMMGMGGMNMMGMPQMMPQMMQVPVMMDPNTGQMMMMDQSAMGGMMGGMMMDPSMMMMMQQQQQQQQMGQMGQMGQAAQVSGGQGGGGGGRGGRDTRGGRSGGRGGRGRGRGRGGGGGGSGGGGGGAQGGYSGMNLAGLPPSATVSSEYAHLYQQ